MRQSQLRDTFFALIRLGIGHPGTVQFGSVDWQEIEALASRQGLGAVILDGVEELRKRNSEAVLPEKRFLTQWIGEVVQGFECRYERYREAIAEMAGFYTGHGFKMMILKGYACSVNWPKPEHRPAGDIDIWLFGRQKEADAIMAKEKGIKIDSDRQHHTVFNWRNFMVENHFDFLDVHHHKSNKGLERILKDMGQDDSHYLELHCEKIFVPSPNLHALFLIKHASAHFAAEGITIRHLLDWGFYVKANTKEIDWAWLEGILKQYGMMPAFNIFNAICVEDLGFEASLFPCGQFDPSLKEKVLEEILNPAFSRSMPKGILNRVLYKIRRWRGNAWKHELCYCDSLWSAFWSGVFNHLNKPKTI